MTSPQPMQLRRRGGAKRGDHGSYVAQTEASQVPTTSDPSRSIGTDNSPSRSSADSGTPPVTSTATARAKAAYDAKPKVIFRGVDEEVDAKLRAIYKHQLHQPGGVEGWSEWGRTILEEVVAQYEQHHGNMAGGETVRLRPGRIKG